MEENKLYLQIITIAIGIICVASILVPAITIAQEPSRDSITIENPTPYDARYDYYDEDTTIIIDSPSGSTNNQNTTITVGDYILSPATGGSFYIMDGPGWGILLQTAGNTGKVGSISGATADGSSISIDFGFGEKQTIAYDSSAKTMTITTYTYSTETSTVNVDALPSSYMLGPKEDGAYSNARQTYSGSTDYALENRAFKQESIDGGEWVNVFAAKVVSVNGTNVAVRMTYANGAFVAYAATGYTAVAELVMTGQETLVEGTTNLYDGIGATVSLTVTNDTTQDSATEEFTPNDTFALAEVTGTAEDGAAINLYSVIPIVFIIGILMIGVTMFVKKD